MSPKLIPPGPKWGEKLPERTIDDDIADANGRKENLEKDAKANERALSNVQEEIDGLNAEKDRLEREKEEQSLDGRLRQTIKVGGDQIRGRVDQIFDRGGEKMMEGKEKEMEMPAEIKFEIKDDQYFFTFDLEAKHVTFRVSSKEATAQLLQFLVHDIDTIESITEPPDDFFFKKSGNMDLWLDDAENSGNLTVKRIVKLPIVAQPSYSLKKSPTFLRFSRALEDLLDGAEEVKAETDEKAT